MSWLVLYCCPAGQRRLKLTDLQTRDMIKVAVAHPESRKEYIEHTIANTCQYNQDDLITKARAARRCVALCVTTCTHINIVGQY